MCRWLLLQYKIPNEPSAPRVYIWRKLKKIGAVFYQDAIWVLPCTPRTLEQFQWLAAELSEAGGEATLWEAQLALSGKDDPLIRQFIDQVDRVYADILKKLMEAEPDLETLSRQYQQAKSRDYFQSELGRQVKDALLSARGGEG